MENRSDRSNSQKERSHFRNRARRRSLNAKAQPTGESSSTVKTQSSNSASLRSDRENRHRRNRQCENFASANITLANCACSITQSVHLASSQSRSLQSTSVRVAPSIGSLPSSLDLSCAISMTIIAKSPDQGVS